jgi:hypothetical protein
MDLGKALNEIDRRLKALERGSRLTHASLENTALQVYDGGGSLRAVLGMQPDGTTAVNIVNGPPPPQPAAPIVASVLGGVTVSWNGAFADGSPVPLDWSRVEVHASASSPFDPVPATLRGTIETAQGATVVVPCQDPVYVRLVARNTSGAASTPSDTVGPLGPAPVVADDVLDGIISTVKLADDAVTQAKIATAAVGSTEIADDAVTTPKLVAGAVQAGKIAADAVQAGNIAANAVTADKIAALAVTADKIAANAITAGKIQAGAVDATALAADAITGKTITGGTVTGALVQTATTGERITLNEGSANKVLVYDGVTASAIAELSKRGLIVQGTNGSTLWLDPNNTVPNLRLTNQARTNSAIINVSGTNAVLGLNSGLFTSGGFTDWKWRTLFGEASGTEFWAAERVRDSDTSTPHGGRVFLSTGSAQVSYFNSTDPTQNLHLFIQQGQMRLNAAGTDKFAVDKDGNLTVTGIGQRVTKRRTSDATRTNTTTASNDTQLTFTVDANAVYVLDGYLKYSGPGDFLMGWTVPTGTLGEWQGLGNGTTAISATSTGSTQQDIVSSWGYTVRTESTDIADTRTYGGVATTAFGIQVRALFRVGSTGGTLALRWAQGTTHATATTLYTDSHLRLEKVA